MSFRSFYARRARRLLPALSVMIVAVVTAAPLLSPVGARGVTQRTGLAAGLFSANGYLYAEGDVGYFDPAAELNPLLHTWSLSVEEQFYFVIPALVLVVWRLGRRRGDPLRLLRLFVAAVMALSLLASLYFSDAGEVGGIDGLRFAFYSPLTRAWQFAAGLALVLVPVGWYRSASVRRVAVTGGLGLIAVACLLYTDTTPFPGTAALVPTLGAALVIFGGTVGGPDAPPHPPRPVSRLLIWVGDRSYSWYLWHLPVIVFASAFWPNGGTQLLVAAATASLIPAVVSYRVLEQPLRSRRPARMAPTAALAAVCIVGSVVMAAISLPLDDLVARLPAVTAFDDARAFHADREQNCAAASRRPDSRRCRWGPPDATTSVVLIGDSNAGQFSESLIDAARQDGLGLRIVTRPACPFIDAVRRSPGRASVQCQRFIDRSLEEIEADPPDLLVLANATDIAVERDGIAMVDPASGREATDTEGRAAIFEAGLHRMLERLGATGARVALIGVVPKPIGWEPDRCSSLLLLVDADRCSFAPFRAEDTPGQAVADDLEARAASAGGAVVWDFDERLCPDGRCVGSVDGRLVWRDEGHISVATARALAQPVRAEITSILG